MSETPYLIGICGGSGSGKTTLSEALHRAMPSVELSTDAYYLNEEDVPLAIRGNVDHPQAIDSARFLAHLNDLEAGKSIQRPCYDFTTHRRTAQTETINPHTVIILDGVLLFALEGVLETVDLSIFVDTPADIRLARRIRRDVS